MLADAPVNDEYQHRDELESQDIAPEEVHPKYEHIGAEQVLPGLDCWTQNRSKMAGAPPCSSSDGGPVQGNAKVRIMDSPLPFTSLTPDHGVDHGMTARCCILLPFINGGSVLLCGNTGTAFSVTG